MKTWLHKKLNSRPKINNRYPGSGSYRGGSGGFGGGFYKNKPGYNNRKISTDSGFSVGSVSTVGTMDSEDLEVRPW